MPGAQKKGQPRVVGLYIGGADATGIQPTLSTIEQSRAILRVVVDAMASAMNAGQSSALQNSSRGADEKRRTCKSSESTRGRCER